MAFMIVSHARLREGREDEYLALMGRLRDLLRREGRGLRYWAHGRSVAEPDVFHGVVVWETREDERRMVNHPHRVRLVTEIAPLLSESATVVGPVIADLVGAGRAQGV